MEFRAWRLNLHPWVGVYVMPPPQTNSGDKHGHQRGHREVRASRHSLVNRCKARARVLSTQKASLGVLLVVKFSSQDSSPLAIRKSQNLGDLKPPSFL